MENLIPNGCGHLDPRYISKEEFHFFFPDYQYIPERFSNIDIVRGISFFLFKTRNVANKIASINGFPAWVSNLELSEYQNVLKVERYLNFLIDHSLIGPSKEVLHDEAA